MKFRALITSLLVVVAMLLASGIVGFWWITSSSPLRAMITAAVSYPTTTIFVSKQSPALVSLLINPDQLETLRLVDAPLRDRKQIHRELEQVKRKLLAGTGLDYQQDVQPWLGDEVTLAVTAPDLDRNSETGYQPGYLLIVTTRDPTQSQAFLERLWQKQSASRDLVVEPYGGVKLIHSTPSQSQPGSSDIEPGDIEPGDNVTLATAQVGDRFVLFGNSPKVIREAITNAQAKDLNLDSSDLYQQALDQATAPRLGIGFFNLPRTVAWLTDEAIPFAEDTASTHLFDGLLVTLDLEQGGLLAQSTLLAPPNQTLLQAAPALSAPVAALQFVPESSPFVAAGQDLQSLWQEIAPELDSYTATHQFLGQNLKQLQQAWGITSWSDLVGWVDGEYALSLLSDKQSTPDWIFAAEKTPRVEAAIAHFNEIAQQQRLTAGAIDVEGQAAIAWTKLLTVGADRRRQPLSLQALVQAVHTTVGEYEVFASSLDALRQSLLTAQAPTLSPNLQQAIATLDPDNDGYFYVDWAALKSWVLPKLSVRRLAEVSQLPFVESVRSLTISGYGTEMNLRQGGIFLQLNDY